MILANRAPIDTDGRMLVTTTVPDATWPVLGGMTYKPDTGALAVIDAVPAAGDPWVGGIRFTPIGQMYVTVAAMPAGVEFIGGLPVTDDGRVVASAGVPVYGVGGWPVAAGGGISMVGTAPPATVPDAPAAPVAVAGDTIATVTFVAPADGGSPITGYAMQSVPATTTQSPTGSPYVFTGLTNGVSYQFKVAAINAIGQGAYSPLSNAVTPSIPLTTPIFYAPLITSLVPSINGGASGLTWSRSSTAAFRDFEGILRTAPISAARFVGARMVQNLIVASAAPATQGVTVIAGQYVISFTGTGTITWSGAAAGSLVGQGASTRVGSTPITCTAGTLTLTMSGTVTLAQCELVSGQSNQAPSTYVSKGTLATPWHGAGVDGVKFFDTVNGNSLASGVVTDAAGAAIAAATLKGYLNENARTNNLVKSSEFDFSAIWTTNSSLTFTPAATVAPDGTLTGMRIDTVSSSITNLPQLYQSSGMGLNKTVVSVFAKAGNLSWLGLGFDTEVKTEGAYFNLTTGVIGTVVANSVATMEAFPNGWYRCSVYRDTGTFGPSAHARITIEPHSADNQVRSWTTGGAAAAGQNIYVWGAQYEQSGSTITFASSYIAATGSTASRSADSLQYNTSGNLVSATGSWYGQADLPLPTDAGNAGLVKTAGGDGSNISIIAGNFTPLLFDGANSSTFTPALTIPGQYKISMAWSGVVTKCAIGGAMRTPGVFDGSFGGAASIFTIGAGSNAWFGTIKDYRIYGAALSDAEMQAITT